MKRILITGGATNEYIDEVMKITNMSTGRLSIELSHLFTCDENNFVTLIGNRAISKNSLTYMYGLTGKSNFKFVPIETTADMFNALQEESKNSYDMVIHTSAVADYKPQYSFKLEDIAKELVDSKSTTYEEILAVLTNPQCKVNDDTKISSYEPNLTVKLTLTPKLISHLREWFPNAKIIGFKLLENVTKEHIIDVANKLCIKNNADYIIANDLAELRKANHISYLVDKNGYCDVEFKSPVDIHSLLKSLLV